jgi:hypothetical protein
MTEPQSKLTWSWVIGGITIVLAAYLVGDGSHSWFIPMFIGMSIVRYLRKEFDYGEVHVFQIMSSKMKIFSVVFYFALAIYVISTVLNAPEIISRHSGILLMLVFVPIAPTAIQLELQLFKKLGNNNA